MAGWQRVTYELCTQPLGSSRRQWWTRAETRLLLATPSPRVTPSLTVHTRRRTLTLESMPVPLCALSVLSPPVPAPPASSSVPSSSELLSSADVGEGVRLLILVGAGVLVVAVVGAGAGLGVGAAVGFSVGLGVGARVGAVPKGLVRSGSGGRAATTERHR